MLRSFAYHGVTVSDLDRSIDFYQNLLHMKLERTYEQAGEDLEKATGFPGAHIKVAVLSHEGRLLKLIQYLFPERKKRFEARLCDIGASHLDIQVDDVQGAYEELHAKGVKFISPPVIPPWLPPTPERPEIKFAYMLDPDDIVLELHYRTIEHHSHAVSDLDRAVAFYRDILGLKVLMIREFKGQGIEEGTGLPGVHLRSGHMVLDTDESTKIPHSIELHHYVHPEGKKQSGVRLCDVGCSHVAFEVDDVQQAYEEFRGKGAKFISRPVHPVAERPEVTSVYMLDVDSYVLELRSGGGPI
ncbi:VOC family protein [Chloroflexota bacterium]